MDILKKVILCGVFVCVGGCVGSRGREYFMVGEREMAVASTFLFIFQV